MDDRFRETAARQPDHPAIVGPRADAAMTYRQLDEAIEAASAALDAAGVKRGSCIGLHVPSSPQYIIWNYAIWRRGGCVVPIPVELADDEKAQICRQIALGAVISRPDAARFAQPYAADQPRELSSGQAMLPLRSPREHPCGFDRVDAAFIRFTSGTTGSSKGVVLSHQTIAERIAAANQVLDITPRDRILWVLSMSYHFTVSIVGYLSLGATILLPANHFAAAIFECIRRHQATLLYASPLHLALLADSREAPRLESLRLAISTTSSLESAVARRFHHRCGLPVTQALGIIEIGLPCINIDFAAERPESVGRVLPAYQVKLEDVGLGPEMQEILFCGPGFLDAYYDPWRPRDLILEGGWFRTGDVGRLDEHGCLWLGGRSKDVINVMGMKFFPQEVERVLASHPAVQAAVVFGCRDERWGEAPFARVVPREGTGGNNLETELKSYCQQRLAAYKVPERIELVASLPTTASGKVLHRGN
jgi:long-chain acyl-CoA synthetase